MATNYLKLKKQLEELKYTDPNITVIEDEKGNKVNESIKPNLNKYVSPIKRTNFVPVTNVPNADDIKNILKKTAGGDGSGWFTAGAFEDGYQFGDVTKTVLGTANDIYHDAIQGAIGIGEKAIDAGASAVGWGAEKIGFNDFANSTKEFVKKDLINEEQLATTLTNISPTGILNNTINGSWENLNPFDGKSNTDAIERNSVLGTKTDSLVQSGGQLGATILLQGVGVPWQLTTGGTAFGAEAENALKNDATYDEAMFSATFSAGAEVLTESLFRIPGIKATGSGKFGNKLIEKFGADLTNTTARNMLNFGINMAGEAGEEVTTSFFQRLGQVLSYEREETIQELMTDEEARDKYIKQLLEKQFGEEAREEYIDAAIGGMALAGVAGGPNIYRANKAGRDINTGLTNNEQAMLDKEVSERVKEAEQDGKKLDKKEKAKIEEQVREELQKGYISTGAIESVLGGEEYNAYKTALDKQNRYNELMDKNVGETTNREKLELEALTKELADLDINTLKSNLESSMSQKIANDGYLQRSYLEKANKSVKFEADLSKYDAKQQEVIKKAIDSGILNDTNKTHEFVDMIAKISADKGVSFDFANNAKLKESGFAVEGKQVNGFVNENGITLNIDSSNALNKVVGHEITHVLEGTELYTELQQAVKEYATMKGEYDTRLANLTELYKGVDNANVENELTSDLVGEYLFTDADFVNNLSTTKPNVFQKIYNEIKYLLKVATAGSKEARQLEKVKKTFEEAYRNSQANVTNDTQYSLNDYQEYTNKVNETLEKAKNIDEKFYNDLKAQQEEYRERHQLEYNILEETNSRPATNEKINDVFFKEHRSEYDENRGIKTADGKLTVMHLQKGDNLAKLSFTEGEDKIWIDELYVKNQKQGYGSEIVNAIKKYADENGKYVEAFKELSTAKGFWDKTLRNGAKYSLTDNQGRTLTKEQQEFFKDSKVRDEEGNLLEVYHGTPYGGFTEFDKNMFGNTDGGGYLGDGFYFANTEDLARAYTDEDYEYSNPEIKSVYLNMTNPYIISDKDVEYGENMLEELGTSTEQLKNQGYDGIIYELNVDESIQEIVFKKTGKRNTKEIEYVVFEPNQIKNVDNTNPTSDPDIRYSLGEDTAPKQSNLTYGEDVALQISPLQEEISKVVEEVQQMREQIDKMTAPMPEYRNNTYEDLDALEQQYNEDFENIDTENVPQGIDDDSTFFLPNEVNMVESEKQVKDVIRNTLGLNTKQTSDVYKSIVAIEDFDIDDVKNAIEEYSQFITSDNDTNLQDLKKAIRTTKLDISYLKATDSNFKDSVKNAFGTMRIANSGQSIDSFYNEMSSMYPDLLPNNIDNEADQFQRLLEVSKMDHVTKYTEAIPEETMNEYANEIYKTIKNYQDNLAIQNSNRDFFNAVKNGEIIAPVESNVDNVEETPSNKETKISPTRSEVDWDSVEDTSKGKQATFNDETQTIVEEDLVKKTKKELRRSLLGTEIQREFFTNALDNAKNRSKALMNNTDTIRNTELVFGRDAANIINEKIFQKEIDNEANSIKWQNEQRKEIKDLGIKARSKESAAVQKYGEKQYVNDAGEVVPYGDAELAREFSDIETQNKIKNAAKELRSKYDAYIDLANGVLTKLGFDPIPKRNDYMRHFQELNDVFSRYGIPFNAQNMAEHTLPTDINGLTEFWSPQKNYFANMQARKGVKTTYDAITGIDGYISGISNLIFHTEDIQRGRAFEELIRETYGEDKGWDNLENLPDELKQARAEKIQDNHLSNYAAWVHEWTNNIAGKKHTIDRSVESFIGRKAFSFLDTARKQVGSNMIGFNLSSSLTNLIAPVQAIAKTNKLAALKGTADTIKNIFIKDNFIEKNKFLTSRMGTDMLSKNAWQKMQDAGYIFMKGMDWFSSNQIVRSKYYELRSKGMSETEAHAEAGKFAARIMGDRTKGANAQLYNSKLLSLATQFQLEVNNQLYSMFYDTYHESKENAKGNALRTAAGTTFTLGQLFVFTHLFGKTFEAIAGYNPTFDIIGILMTALGLDDDDEEKTTSERLKEASDQLVDALPYVNILTGGGRIPVLSGIPNLVGVATGGKDEYGNELKLEDEMKKLLYLVPPTGGNQFKKTTQGLAMFDKDLPVSGSYTDSGNLRFPVEDTPLNKIQAAMFGQWANKNAGEYFDNKRQPLKEKQIQEYIDLKLPIADYWEYRDGLTEQKTIKDKFEYINGLDVADEQKNIMINNAVDRKEDIDMSNYDDFGSYEEFDFAIKNEEKYDFLQKNNISYNDYAASDESKDAYNWAYNNPEKYVVAKAITEDIVTYRQYTKELNDITADKDSDGKTISGSRKAKVFNYINNLDLGFEQKVMLAKLEYPSYDEYNYDIVDYLNNDDSIDYQTMTSILTELGFKVDANGNVSWD